MAEFLIQSPTRVDLAGGTLDVGKLYLNFSRAVTVNFAINIMTSARLVPRDDSRILLKVTDFGVARDFADLDSCLKEDDPNILLIQKFLTYWLPRQGFELETASQSPVGGGIGGSSSLLISIIKAFCLWERREINPVRLAELAGNIEQRVLAKPTGTQDYYPPMFGGLNIITYDPAGTQVKVLPLPDELFTERFLLVNSGKSHHSGLNNWEFVKQCYDQDESSLEVLKELHELGIAMELIVSQNHWNELPEAFAREIEARKRLSMDYVSPIMEDLLNVAIDAGGEGAKICGSGGGGCVMIWCRPGKKNDVARACQEAGFEVLAAQGFGKVRV